MDFSVRVTDCARRFSGGTELAEVRRYNGAPPPHHTAEVRRSDGRSHHSATSHSLHMRHRPLINKHAARHVIASDVGESLPGRPKRAAAGSSASIAGNQLGFDSLAASNQVDCACSVVEADALGDVGVAVE